VKQHAVDRDDRQRTAERMVEVAIGHCKILEELDYGPGHIKVSLKATDVWTNVMANRLFAAQRPYPIHLGVTESGPIQAGSIRSAVGLGILLSEGIGDTIRVSLATRQAGRGDPSRLRGAQGSEFQKRIGQPDRLPDLCAGSSTTWCRWSRRWRLTSPT